MDGLIECPYLCKSDWRIFRLKDLLESSHICRYPLEYRQKKGVFGKNSTTSFPGSLILPPWKRTGWSPFSCFLRRGRQPQENISRARNVLSPRFLYYSSLMEKRYLAMWMWLCEGKLKVKTAHFRLPSVSQKRACPESVLARNQNL